MKNWAYKTFRPHIGHKIVCVCYGKDGEEPEDICIECEDCNEVLVSASDLDDLAEQEKLSNDKRAEDRIMQSL